MKNSYLQAYLHLKTYLHEKYMNQKVPFLNDYIFVQSAIENVIEFESDSFSFI